MNDDVIQSFWGYSEYATGFGWFGGIDELQPGWGYMYYSNRTEAVIVELSAPASQTMVTTGEPTSITAESAVVGGTVTVPEGTHVFLRGVCWGTEPNPDIDGSHTTEETGIGSFSSTLESLNPNTTYYVRAYAVSDYGLAYGNELSFTTLSGIPVVTTTEVTDVTGNSALCGGTVTDDGGLAITARGVCWSTSHNPTLSDSHTTDGTGTGSFTSSITGLGTSTTYYVRAYATTAQATSYGEEMTFTTMNGIPTVSTAEVTDITATTATCGGTIATDGGLAITARGVCWSTSHNPTLGDSHTTDGTGMGSFTSTITDLSASTTYYVRAYATNSLVTIYGGEQSFTTEAGGGSGGDHAYVDLGLPSGLLWATCNVGADTPEDYGDYFAWGETQPKDNFSWMNYQYCMGSFNTLTKYCNNPDIGYNGFTDNLTTLEPSDDAATANWGDDWRMPTDEEWQELYQNTTVTWTQQNGMDGRLFTASNGNSLFLPNAGFRINGDLHYPGTDGRYWSSTLYTGSSYSALAFCFYSGAYSNVYEMHDVDRYFGFSVRPVRCKNNVIVVTANTPEGGSVSGGGTYLEGTNCTVSATANEGYIFVNWTEDGEEVSTEATYSFTVTGNRTLIANFAASGSGGDHAYVDLGLPSGLLWATCNVGAEAPEDYGDYFAWGETQTKDTYNWNTYQYCMGSENTLTKYCHNSSYGYNGFTDNLTTLLPEDDAATANWGSDWRMPTEEEWEELYQYTTVTWTTRNGVRGRLFTAENGNSLFLPAAGYRSNSGLYYAGSNGRYWSSLLNDYSDYPYLALYLNFYSFSCYVDGSGNRGYGQSVRPVRSSAQNNAPTGAINGKFTINDNGDQVYFSQGNLQYIGSASTPYWKFADNQWDVLGTTSGQNSSSQNVDRDLFGWGTSGWNNGNTYYQPWSTADEENNYGLLYGPPGQYDLSGSYANADWGVYNPISNGGNQANQWRTLTQPEWAYVFNTRTTNSGIRYAKAKVNNVNGVILLPDDWSSVTYSLSNTNTNNASFSSNTISASQWNTLEQAGAVFLPAAGSRNGTSVYNVGGCCYYWSASYYDSYDARHVSFYDSHLGTDYSSGRYYGFSVRLARVAE